MTLAVAMVNLIAEVLTRLKFALRMTLDLESLLQCCKIVLLHIEE